jgi:hypothetical protein
MILLEWVAKWTQDEALKARQCGDRADAPVLFAMCLSYHHALNQQRA